ncbi:hypothetical protein BJV77DRAFT_946916, partial [Russula vinacea]
QYPQFHDIPSFPHTGGAFDIGHTLGPNCGKCWKLTNLQNGHSIVITAIDNHAERGFVISEWAFKVLDDDHLGLPLEEVEPRIVPRSVCGL